MLTTPVILLHLGLGKLLLLICEFQLAIPFLFTVNMEGDLCLNQLKFFEG